MRKGQPEWMSVPVVIVRGMTATAKVLRSGVTLGGWRGSLQIDGDVISITSADANKRLEIDAGQVKRYSFNSLNGLWAIRMKDGRKLYVQTSGALLSADRSPEGAAATDAIGELLNNHHVRGLNM